jgi:hypothetical protein
MTLYSGAMNIKVSGLLQYTLILARQVDSHAERRDRSNLQSTSWVWLHGVGDVHKRGNTGVTFLLASQVRYFLMHHPAVAVTHWIVGIVQVGT